MEWDVIMFTFALKYISFTHITILVLKTFPCVLRETLESSSSTSGSSNTNNDCVNGYGILLNFMSINILHFENALLTTQPLYLMFWKLRMRSRKDACNTSIGLCTKFTHFPLFSGSRTRSSRTAAAVCKDLQTSCT